MSAHSSLMKNATHSSPWRAAPIVGGGGRTPMRTTAPLRRCRRRSVAAAAAAAVAAAPPPRPFLPLRSPQTPLPRLLSTTTTISARAAPAQGGPAKNSQAAADQFFSAGDREAALTFAELLQQAGGEGRLALRASGGGAGGGRGLFAERAASPGEVLLRVPLSACLSVAYAAGGDGRVSTPEIPGDAPAAWPRLAGGVRRAAAAAEAAAEEAALAEADDEDDGGRPASSASPGAADEVEALTWDVLLALGVMDALAGDGGDWWARYAAALFPAPEAVPLPMCWPEPLLAALRHASVAEAARAQKLRLRLLYPPFCSTPAAEGAPNGGAPSYMQWSFACVRSRVCRLTERQQGGGGGAAGAGAAATFALVPFLDCANHSDRPNAAYRLVTMPDDDERVRAEAEEEEEEDRRNNGNGSNDGNGRAAPPSSSSCVELVAMSAVAAGDEVCISYTGPPPAAATNRLLMAQYGFVPAGGNPRDRYEELAFGAFSLRDPKRSAAAAGAAAGAGAGGGGEPAAAAAGFRLRAVQGAVGDGVFLSALKGDDPYAFAALKSLPLARDEQDAARAASEAGLPLRPEFAGGGAGGNGSGGGDDDANAPCPPDAAERALAERLLVTLRSGPLAELKADRASVREALEQDEALLARLLGGGEGGGGGGSAPPLSRDEADPRLAAAVRYRVERARLMLSVERVLLALAAAP